ncbi:MAG: hypothetical protein Q8Q23_01755 [bacterium]|nr:hypothetical protein [bacterium]
MIVSALLNSPAFFNDMILSIRYALGVKMSEDIIISTLPSELPLPVREKLVTHAKDSKEELTRKELNEIFNAIEEFAAA